MMIKSYATTDINFSSFVENAALFSITSRISQGTQTIPVEGFLVFRRVKTKRDYG